MKKSTVWNIVALIAAGIVGGAYYACGWYNHMEYVEKTKFEI